MLAIKLQRIGKKHRPSYRVVVAEKRSKMAAPPVEDLGSYNSFTKSLVVDKTRALYWIEKGACPTATVHNLLVRGGAISEPKRAISIKKKQSTETPTAAPASGDSAQGAGENKEE